MNEEEALIEQVKLTLKHFEVEATDEEIADFVMLKLINKR